MYAKAAKYLYIQVRTLHASLNTSGTQRAARTGYVLYYVLVVALKQVAAHLTPALLYSSTFRTSPMARVRYQPPQYGVITFNPPVHLSILFRRPSSQRHPLHFVTTTSLRQSPYLLQSQKRPTTCASCGSRTGYVE